jgi:hypothetical protein
MLKILSSIQQERATPSDAHVIGFAHWDFANVLTSSSGYHAWSLLLPMQKIL